MEGWEISSSGPGLDDTQAGQKLAGADSQKVSPESRDNHTLPPCPAETLHKNG